MRVGVTRKLASESEFASRNWAPATRTTVVDSREVKADDASHNTILDSWIGALGPVVLRWYLSAIWKVPAREPTGVRCSCMPRAQFSEEEEGSFQHAQRRMHECNGDDSNALHACPSLRPRVIASPASPANRTHCSSI